MQEAKLSVPIALCLFAGACASQPRAETADTVYTNGRIYTVNEAQPWAEAVAIKDGKFLGVGSNADVEAVTGEDTEVVDLAGQFVMPGFFDLHVHPFTTALNNMLNLDFSDNRSHESMMAELKAFAEAHPEKEWIRGGSWGMGVYPDENPHKRDLDAVVPDRPVILIDASGHYYWLNSKAPEMVGITSETPSGKGAVIEKDPTTGEPTGTIRESAIRLVEQVATQPTLEEWVEIEDKILHEFASFGVTSMQTAEASDPTLAAVVELEKQGRLPVRLFASWDWHAAQITSFTNEEMDAQIAGRSKFETERIKPNYVKIFGDGAPAGFGCLFVDEYTGVSGEHGNSNLSAEEFKDVFAEFDRNGVGVFVHTIGDGTTRLVLDAFEHMRKVNGDSGVRHKLAHLAWVDPDDVPRLAEIQGLAAELSPGILHYQPGVYESLRALLGEERVARAWNLRGLLDAGVSLGYGSDWLTIAPINPFPQLQSFVTRRNPDHPELPTMGEGATIEEAIRIFTYGGAYGVGAEDELGSIEVGKYADFIVLDRDLTATPPEQIRDTAVVTTISGGAVVYEAAQDPGWKPAVDPSDSEGGVRLRH